MAEERFWKKRVQIHALDKNSRGGNRNPAPITFFVGANYSEAHLLFTFFFILLLMFFICYYWYYYFV